MSFKAFYNSVLSFEGDIFKGCEITWKPFRKTLVVGLLETASKLEEQSVFINHARYTYGGGRNLEQLKKMGARD